MLTRRSFIGGIAAASAVAGSAALAGCSGGSGNSGSSSAASASAQAAGSSDAAASQQAQSQAGQTAQSKSAVVFFSRAGENYEVGVVDEGSTSIIAHAIAGKVVSDVFEIVPVEEYPFSYEECAAQAQQEKDAHARPALLDSFAGFDQYGEIYLGYPIWHSDLPMILYTFVESKDWAGKKVMPFCTHGSSGLNGTVSTLKSLCQGAEVKEGLAIKGADAQAFTMDVDSQINSWLATVRA